MQSKVQSVPRPVALRILFWAILVVFVALCVWWSTYFAYDAELMRRAVPPYAVWVSEHRDIGARWPDLVGHKVVENVLQGPDAADLRRSLSDPSLARWLDRLTGQNTLTAYVPENTPGAPITGLVVVSWVGKYGQFLRWGLLNRATADFASGRARDGSRIWRMESDGFPRGYVLSLSSCEGIALACLSPDRDAAAYLRTRVARRAASIDRFAALPGRVDPAVAESPDRVWGRLPGVKGFQNVCAGMTTTGADSIELAVSGYRLPVEPHVLSRQDVASMWPLLRDTPDCIIAAPTADVREALGLFSLSTAVSSTIRDIVEQSDPAGATFACVASGDHSGRILAMRVPSLVIGVRMAEGFDIQAATTSILDRLSSEQGKGFIPCSAIINGHSVITIGDASATASDIIPMEERPAVAAWHGWLLAASNARVLGQYLADVDLEGGGGVETTLPGMPPWARELTTGSLNAYLWADSHAICGALSNVAAVYEMYLIVKRPSGSRAKRARVKAAKQILSYVSSAGEIVLRVEQNASTPRANLRITAEPAERPVKGLESSTPIR